jgi:hypothetical protein
VRPFLCAAPFRTWAGIGRTKIYEEIAAGRLRAVNAGGRTLIPLTAAESWPACLPPVRTIPAG